jgi:hypothetical protein
MTLYYAFKKMLIYNKIRVLLTVFNIIRKLNSYIDNFNQNLYISSKLNQIILRQENQIIPSQCKIIFIQNFKPI